MSNGMNQDDSVSVGQSASSLPLIISVLVVFLLFIGASIYFFAPNLLSGFFGKERDTVSQNERLMSRQEENNIASRDTYSQTHNSTFQNDTVENNSSRTNTDNSKDLNSIEKVRPSRVNGASDGAQADTGDSQQLLSVGERMDDFFTQSAVTPHQDELETSTSPDNLVVADMSELDDTNVDASSVNEAKLGSFEIEASEAKSTPLVDEKTLEIRRQEAQQSKLEQLQASKSQTRALQDQGVIQQLEPQNQNVQSLSNESYGVQMGDVVEDPHITPDFLEEVVVYSLKNLNGQQGEPRSIMDVVRHFGISMKGLEHPNGRKGIFDYAYHPKMIEVLYRNFGPAVAETIKNQMKQKGLSKEDSEKYLRSYAQMAQQASLQLEAILNTESLNANLEYYINLQTQRKQYQQAFAAAQLEQAEMARQNKNTDAISEQMRKDAVKIHELGQQINSYQNIIMVSIAKKSPHIKISSDLVDLALWVHRRNNDEATKSAAEVLQRFSTLLYPNS